MCPLLHYYNDRELQLQVIIDFPVIFCYVYLFLWFVIDYCDNYSQGWCESQLVIIFTNYTYNCIMLILYSKKITNFYLFDTCVYNIKTYIWQQRILRTFFVQNSEAEETLLSKDNRPIAFVSLSMYEYDYAKQKKIGNLNNIISSVSLTKDPIQEVGSIK